MTDIGKKIKFIMFWYTNQSRKLNLSQKLDLLRQWINTCAKYEEYEMATSLKKERCRIMKEYRKEVGGIKRKFRRLFVRLKYVIRKVKNIIN